MERADILVVGGGFTGASLATAMADGRRRVLVLEARAGKNPRFAGELIHPTGVDVLQRLGLLGSLAAGGGRSVKGFAVIRERGADPTLLPYAEIPGSRPDGFAMEHHDMVARLREQALRRPGVEIRTGCRVTDVVREGGRVAGVRTEAGEEIRANLVLAAEGRHSKLRGLLGFPERARLLSFSAAVLAQGAGLPAPGYGHIFLGAWGPILAYAIGDGRVRMVLDLPSAEQGGPKGQAQVAERLRSGYAPFVPEPLRSAMLAALDAGPVEMAANYSISTQRCVAPGVALVGESGGCSHPLTAAGMTVCLTDIRLLAEELAAPGDPDRALARYEKRRYRFVRAREILADALYEVFRAAEDGTRALRHGIFRYWDGSRRARATSMALLSGHQSRLAVFLEEYLRVVAQSITGVLTGEVNDRSIAGRAKSLGGLGDKAWEKLGLVVAGVREGTLR
jgi:squalene monooxygenase